jgi:foldase protein PrsA
VSPERGRKASGKRGGRSASGRPDDRVAARRRALLLFGVAFVALFAVVGISEGVGDPSIPEGNVVYVEDVPDGGGEISKAEFDHALELAAKQGGQEKVPKPGDKQYEELKETALTSLLESAWLEGEAAEMGIEVTQQEIDKEREKIKDENFPSEAEFKKFLKESGFTPEDIDERVKLQILSTEIQQKLQQNPPQPSRGEIEDYYEAAKATQFTQPASRDVRLIRNKDRGKAEKALATLEKGNTAKDWNRVAKELSEDPATKGKGGLQQNVAEGTLEEPLGADVFESPEGQLEGPVKTQQGYTVFEVQNSTPEEVQELKSVESQIESQLSQQAEQEQFNTFVADFNSRWVARTFCADDYVTERCANYEDDGRPASAPPACYEEDPKGGRPEACPAAVFQAVPAMPGSVTPLAPQGNPLAQRPHPAGEGTTGGEAPPTGLPEGVPPTGE